MEARLDGVVTGEAGINALVAAHYGVPVVLVTGDRCACEETAALIPGVHAAVVKEHGQPGGRAQPAPGPGVRADPGDHGPRRSPGAAAAAPPPLEPGVLELSVRTTDIAEAASWVRGRGADRRRGSCASTGDDPLATYRSFCAAILLTRGIAETV